jgi:hypothetical protein
MREVPQLPVQQIFAVPNCAARKKDESAGWQ